MRPTYTPAYVVEPDKMLEALLTLDWLQVTEARLEYFMSDEPRSYTYGKPPNDREYHSNPYSIEAEVLRLHLNATYGCNYSVCFLNRYDNQKHQLGWHADDSPTMDRDHPIAVISFGAVREIWWKPQADKGLVPEDQRQRLGHGSLFVMPPRFQDSYFHRIPRADREVGTRVSLTFRRYLTAKETT